MQSKLVRIESLRSDPKNARKHNEKNISVIAESLKRFGQRKPIVISGDIVIAGNGTLQAAQYLGWKEITVVETPKDWDEETIRAYALADNRSAELAEWDLERLSEQLFELEETLNVEDLGFNLPKLDTEEEPIEDFKSYDETMATSHACPKCGYEWNGSSK